MKKLQLILWLLLAGTLVYGQEKQVKTGPLMHFEEKTYDFGKVISGDTVEHTFVFENRGTEPLKILSARGSCGCTVPIFCRGRNARREGRGFCSL